MVQIIQGGCEECEEEWRMYGEYKEYENNIKKKWIRFEKYDEV